MEPRRTGRSEAKAESIACSGRLFVTCWCMSRPHWQRPASSAQYYGKRNGIVPWSTPITARNHSVLICTQIRTGSGGSISWSYYTWPDSVTRPRTVTVRHRCIAAVHEIRWFNSKGTFFTFGKLGMIYLICSISAFSAFKMALTSRFCAMAWRV